METMADANICLKTVIAVEVVILGLMALSAQYQQAYRAITRLGSTGSGRFTQMQP